MIVTRDEILLLVKKESQLVWTSLLNDAFWKSIIDVALTDDDAEERCDVKCRKLYKYANQHDSSKEFIAFCQRTTCDKHMWWLRDKWMYLDIENCRCSTTFNGGDISGCSYFNDLDHEFSSMFYADKLFVIKRFYFYAKRKYIDNNAGSDSDVGAFEKSFSAWKTTLLAMSKDLIAAKNTLKALKCSFNIHLKWDDAQEPLNATSECA